MSAAALAVSAAAASASATAAAAPPQLRVAVIGGSIGGLAAATALLRLGASVRVFERAPGGFSGRGGSLGFCQNNLWEALRGAPMMRRGARASRAQGAYLYGDLWDYLASGLPSSSFSYNAHVRDLGEDLLRPTVMGETFDLAVIADGGWSELRTRHFGPAAPQFAGWQAWRFRVEAKDVPGFSAFGEYSAGFYSTILLDVAMNNGSDWIMGGTSCACPESDVVRPGTGVNRQTGGSGDGGVEGGGGGGGGAGGGGAGPAAPAESETPAWFLPFFRGHFGSAAGGEVYRAMEAASRLGKITATPQYEFCASRVVKGRVVLVGDAAHMAVPRTAAGAHTAVLDGYALLEAFRPHLGGAGAGAAGGSAGWGAAVYRALAAYEPAALQRARGLYERSLEVSRPVLPPGWSPEAARERVTPERAAAMGAKQLKAELLARRVPLAGLAEKGDLVRALLAAVGGETAP